MPTPEELAAAQAVLEAAKAESKVEFDPRQQAKVEQLIRAAKSESAKDLRNDHAALVTETQAIKEELAAAKVALAKSKTVGAKNEAKGDIEALQAQIAEMMAVSASYKGETERLVAAANVKAKEATDARAEITAIRRDSAIKSAAGQHGFYNAGDVAALTSGAIRWDEGRDKYIVVGEGDQPKFNLLMEPMSLDEFYADYAKKNPYMVRSDFKGGAGSVAGGGSNGTTGKVPLEKIFGKDSDGGVAQRLYKSDPEEYKRRRVQAVELGLLS